MGCTISKADDPPLVSLCRERRDLIRAATDRRFALAAAHSAYFDSLHRVSLALHRFVTEEVTAVTLPPPDDVITLLPSKSSKSVKSDNSNPNGNGDSKHISHSSSSSSSISLPSSSFSDHHHHHLPESSGSEPEPEPEPEPERRFHPNPNGAYSPHLNPNYYPEPHFPYPNYYPDPRFSEYRDPNYYPDPHFAGDRNPNFYPDPHFVEYRNPSFYYMRKATTVPSTYYVDPNTGSFVNPNGYYNVDHQSSRGRPDSPPPPPPPPPAAAEGYGWDFLNVFDTYEQFLMNISRRYGSGSGSTNSSEIREKEGIPELEEETENESFRVENNVVDSSIGSSKTPPLEEVVEEDKSEKGEGLGRKAKKVGFEENDSMRTVTESVRSGRSLSSMVTEESRSGSLMESGSSGGSELHCVGEKDVVEAMEEIKEQFKVAAGCGEELSRLLEVGKRQYRSRNTLLKVIIYRILDSMALSSFIFCSPSSNPVPMPDALKANEAVNSDYINAKSKNLSATLEKLYLWEKKLYKKVKDEEKLRVIYEKECRRLKALDDGGAESYKIDSTRAAIKELVTKINIAITSVEVISKQIHKVRDIELQPQVTDLIRGLVMMWKSMLACHQKQYQAISESKTHNLTVRSKNQSNSAAKATISLELELLNWSSCFRNWISSQKAYIDALNGWLRKWLLEEHEETPDGYIPFSPGRIGAPTVFIVSNDWHHVVERMSGDLVTSSIQLFAENVHQLWETQDEEHRQKLKAEYLSRDFSRRLRSLQKENGSLDASQGKIPVPIPNGHDHIVVALDTMKKRLDEERSKHQDIMKHIQETTTNSLQMGLVPIFEALENYTSETLKAYEGLRLPSDNGEGT